MNKTLKMTVKLIVITFTAIYLTQCNDIKEATIKRFLLTEAEKINQECPQQLNAEVRLDSCKVADKITLKTYATMVNVNADYYNADSFYKTTQPGLLYTIQTSEDLKQAREYGVTFMYIYYDKYGKLLSEIAITPDDYNKPIDDSNVGTINTLGTEQIEVILKRLVESVKPALPMQVDEITTLTNIEVFPDNILVYSYILSMDKNDINTHFNENMHNILKNQAKTNNEIRKLLEAKATLKYIYMDKNQSKLCEVVLTEDCLK